MNASQFAQRMQEDGKKFRKFLRDTTPRDMRPGTGHQWQLPDGGREIRQIQRRYRRWAKVHTRGVS